VRCQESPSLSGSVSWQSQLCKVLLRPQEQGREARQPQQLHAHDWKRHRHWRRPPELQKLGACPVMLVTWSLERCKMVTLCRAMIPCSQGAQCLLVEVCPVAEDGVVVAGRVAACQEEVCQVGECRVVACQEAACQEAACQVAECPGAACRAVACQEDRCKVVQWVVVPIQPRPCKL